MGNQCGRSSKTANASSPHGSSRIFFSPSCLPCFCSLSLWFLVLFPFYFFFEWKPQQFKKKKRRIFLSFFPLVAEWCEIWALPMYNLVLELRSFSHLFYSCGNLPLQIFCVRKITQIGLWIIPLSSLVPKTTKACKMMNFLTVEKMFDLRATDWRNSFS